MTELHHPFDQAIALAGDDPGVAHGHTSEHYWNTMSPFGGVTAATLLHAILLHPQRLGDPLALTVNFAGAIRPGGFVVRVHAQRTGRTTQHWQLALYQGDDPHPAMTGTAVFGVRRQTWGDNEAAMPSVTPPPALERYAPAVRLPFLERYDIRYADCDPFAGGASSLTHCWIADAPRRALDFPALAAYCDAFLPRVFVRQGKPSPIATVTMSMNFHVDGDALAARQWEQALGEARGNAFNGGFHDQEAKLWSDDGTLLATTHQLVWFKE